MVGWVGQKFIHLNRPKKKKNPEMCLEKFEQKCVFMRVCVVGAHWCITSPKRFFESILHSHELIHPEGNRGANKGANISLHSSFQCLSPLCGWQMFNSRCTPHNSAICMQGTKRILGWTCDHEWRTPVNVILHLFVLVFKKLHFGLFELHYSTPMGKKERVMKWNLKYGTKNMEHIG